MGLYGMPGASTSALLAVCAFILAGDEARVRRLLHAGKAWHDFLAASNFD